METREMLEAMLATLQEKDWIQGDSYFPEVPAGSLPDPLVVTGVCLEGAWGLNYSGQGACLDEWQEARIALCKVIRELYPGRLLFPGNTSPFYFNDHKDTTREDVLLVVKTAIEREG